SLTERILKLNIQHQFHEEYLDKSVSPAILQFIHDCMGSTPCQIYQDLQFNELKASEGANITQKQIHYWWSKRSSGIWRQHNDAFTSALMFLQDPIRSQIFSSKVINIGDKLQALAF